MLDLIAEGDIILAGGHLPASELHLVFAEAKSRGVQKMLVNHPDLHRRLQRRGHPPAGRARRLYGALDLHVRRGQGARNTAPDKLAHLIEVAGVDHTVLCSDLGLQGSPRPIEGYRAIVRQLLDLQFSAG